MDPTTVKLLVQIGTYGPLGVMAGVLLILLIRQQKASKEERDKNHALSQDLLELAKDSVKADAEHTAAINAMTKALDRIDGRLK